MQRILETVGNYRRPGRPGSALPLVKPIARNLGRQRVIRPLIPMAKDYNGLFVRRGYNCGVFTTIDFFNVNAGNVTLPTWVLPAALILMCAAIALFVWRKKSR